MFEQTVGLKLVQGSMQDVLRPNEEVTLVKDIFIDSRKRWQTLLGSDPGPKAKWEADHEKQRGGRHPIYILATLSIPTISRPPSPRFGHEI